MNRKLAPSRTGRSAARLRLYVVAALCAALLSLVVVSSFAQRRTAVRVPAGAPEASAPRREPESPRARAEERRREDARARARGRALAARLKARQDGGTVQGAPQVGVPDEGEPGVTRTSDEIMEAQSVAPLSWRHDRVLPEREMPSRKYLPQDPNARGVARTPTSTARVAAAADTAATNAPQTLGTSFTGATLGDSGAVPPDTMGAVGPTQFFVFVNGRLRTFNKATGAADGVINADPDVFFSSVMTPVSGGSLNVNFTSDPMVRYDRLSGRWFLTIIDVPSVNDFGDTPNRYLIAVSDAASSNAITNATVWTFYFVQQDTVGLASSNDEFLDYPSLGIDANALYMGGNMFGATSGAFVGTTAFVIRKSSLLSGGPVVTTAFRGLVPDPQTTDGMLTPRGVDNYDPAATEGYFIGVSNAAFGRLIMRRIGTPAGTPTISADILIAVSATSFPVPVDHLGNANLVDGDLDGFPDGNLDALDDRLYSAHIRGGRLWTAHNIAVAANGIASNSNLERRNGVRWYELNVPPTTGAPTVVQSGTIFDSAATRAAARQFWIPSVMVSGQGHAAFGYSTAGTAFRPDAATNGRLRGDTLGSTQAVNVYTASTGAYNPPSDPGPPRRWGDYSYTSLDPLDDMTMWTIQEFCDAANSWGVRAVRLAAPPPAAPNTASPNSIPAGQSSVSVTITGTSVSGSEFYDPGANLAPPALPFNHVSATVSGGVVVNNVTYNSPTQVTLDLNTTGASPGGKNVTITNPDGQSTTRNNVLFVGTAPVSPILITEFRFRGAAGGNDEFLEVYNNSNLPHTVADTAGGTGYAVVGTNTTGTVSSRCIVPNGTVIPARGHYLCTNNNATGPYSLGGYATGDQTYTTGIVDNGGVAVFSTTTTANWGTSTRFDAVGFSGITVGAALYTEGTPLSPAGGIGTNGEHSFVRRAPNSSGGLPQDTDSNQADFEFVSTTAGTFNTRVSVLGAPGPENLASPTIRNSLQNSLLDPTVSASTAPNRERNTTPNVCNGGVAPSNCTMGTLTIRRSVTNNTAAPLTRLRFRVYEITTLNSPVVVASQAQVRVLNSGSSVVTVNGVPTTVEGTTVETPPAQALGGGLNSSTGRSLVAGTVINTPIAPGQTVNVQWVLGVQVTGNYRFFVNIEALP